MLTLSAKERDRLAVLRQVEDGLISAESAARKLGLSGRQFRRLRRRSEREGDKALIHQLRGRPSNHRLSEKLRAKVLERAREPVFRDFGPTLLSEHLSKDPVIGCSIVASTLRQWMIADGLWSVSRRKLHHRSRRQRRGAFGELVQMDTSIHDWLEGRSSEKLVLIAMIDDATSRLFARFAVTDSSRTNREVIVAYLERFGRMGAIYADRASHFQSQTHTRALNDEPSFSSVIKRGLEILGIELIPALSPQAKGRVERLFGTLQDRLLKEMRVANISTLEEANRFLEDYFIPSWNERFAVIPAISQDFHRTLPEGVDLMEIFADHQQRLIRPDFTIRYQNTFYQVQKREAQPSMIGSHITVSRRLDGALSFFWKSAPLNVLALPGLPLSPPAKHSTPEGHGHRPSKDHPWRKSNMQFSVKH
jgi:winged helix-turn helix protein